MTINDNKKITETIELPYEIKGEELKQILSVSLPKNSFIGSPNTIDLYIDSGGGESYSLRTCIEPNKTYKSIEVHAKHEVYEFGLNPMLIYDEYVSPQQFPLNYIAKSILKHMSENERCKEGIIILDENYRRVKDEKKKEIEVMLQNEYILELLKKFGKKRRHLDKLIYEAEESNYNPYNEDNNNLILYDRLDKERNRHIGFTIIQLDEGYQHRNNSFDIIKYSYDISISQTDFLLKTKDSFIEKWISLLLKENKSKKELYSFAESLDEEEFSDIFSIIIKESLKSYCKSKDVPYKEMLIDDGNLGRVIQKIKALP